MVQKQTQKHFWELRPTKPDLEVPFNFKTYQFRREGIYFIGLNLVIPLLILLITSFALNRGSLAFSTINLVTTFVCLTLSFAYLNAKSSQKLIGSGLLIFYTYILIPNLIAFIFSLIISLTKSDSQWMGVAQIWLQVVSEIIVIWLAFKLTTGLKKRFKLTLKSNWKRLLVILVCGVLVMWGLSTIYNLIFQHTPLAENSNNQNSLVDILEHPQSNAIKIFYIFTLFIFSVIVAPLAEELACRHAWFIGSGNRYAAFLTAPIYFGYLHVQSGDVEHILTYVISGFVLTAIFNYNRGNVAYSWVVHAGFNFLGFALLLA